MKRKRDEWFDVDRSGLFARHVVPSSGKPYQHKCSREVLATVCHYVQARYRGGFSTTEMWQDLDVPATQASTALAFLKEHSLVTVVGRRNYPAGGAIFEHSMTDYYYLVHIASGGAPDVTEKDIQVERDHARGCCPCEICQSRWVGYDHDEALGITTGAEGE